LVCRHKSGSLYPIKWFEFGFLLDHVLIDSVVENHAIMTSRNKELLVEVEVGCCDASNLGVVLLDCTPILGVFDHHQPNLSVRETNYK